MEHGHRIGFPDQAGGPPSSTPAGSATGSPGPSLRVRLWIILSLLLLMISGAIPLLRAADSPVRYEASHRAMGTTFTVVAYGRDSAFLQEVVSQVFQAVDDLDDQMSNYKPDSELSSINREAVQHAVIVEPKLFRLIQDSLEYSQQSGGDFDITVGPLMKSWGFFRGQGRLPSKSELAMVLKRIGYQHIKLDAAARTIRFDMPGVEIDLGAIAKGYAVDRAVEILRENGIRQALVSSGTSSLYALGSPPGEHGWEISVRDPLDTTRAACVLRLQDLSLSVSGNYEKFFTLGGKVYAHIMDPHTGMPVENMLSTVVVSPSATDSDALSTSFFVEGPDAALHYLDRHPNLTAVFFLPETSSRTFRRVTLKSRVNRLPASSFASIDCH